MQDDTLPELPLDLWTSILEKTDISTCLAWCNFQAAQNFLKSEQSRSLSVSEVIATGKEEHLELLLDKLGVQANVGHWSQAVSAGALQMLLLLERHGTPAIPKEQMHILLGQAARDGHLDVVEHLCKNDEWFEINLLHSAAPSNQADLVKFLLDRSRDGPGVRFECRCQVALLQASWSGHVELAQYIFRAYPESHSIYSTEADLQSALEGNIFFKNL